MLQAALRSSAKRSLAYQPARYLASKPPSSKKQSGPANTPRPPAGATPSKNVEPAEAPKPIPSSAVVPSLDFSPGEEDVKQERTGARSSKDSLSSIEQRRRSLLRQTLALLGLGAGLGVWYAGRPWDEDELRAMKLSPQEATHTRWERMKGRFMGVYETFTEPLWPELLPTTPVNSPFHRPYTLLISLDDLLVSSVWDRKHGWRTAKRPGVDYFLAYLSQFYEIVVFTTQYSFTAIPIIEKLDPYQSFILHKLYREACRSENGQPVKDLKYLNRDLSKVILLDTHTEHVSPNPENALILPKWNGEPRDRGLVAMIPFLESIAIFNTPDVRPVLQAYEGKNIPVEYGKQEAEMKRLHLEEWERNHKKGLSRGGLTLSRLFGGADPTSPASDVPLTYLEQKRIEAQQLYLAEMKHIADHKDEWERELKMQREAMEKEMPSTIWGTAQAILAGGPQPPPPQPSTPSSGAPATPTDAPKRV